MDRRKALSLFALSALAPAAALLGGCAGSPARPPAPTTSAPGAPPRPAGPVVGADPATDANDLHAGSRVEVVMQALGQLGTPYVWGGASPHTGFDCSGLVAYVYRQAAQFALPRITYDQARAGRPIGLGEVRPADLVFFNTMRRDFSHVGIFIGEERFVHAPAARGVVRIEHIRADYWRERYNGARRLLG
jgi:cell wall-associated NlpC family hydrolase